MLMVFNLPHLRQRHAVVSVIPIRSINRSRAMGISTVSMFNISTGSRRIFPNRKFQPHTKPICIRGSEFAVGKLTKDCAKVKFPILASYRLLHLKSIQFNITSHDFLPNLFKWQNSPFVPYKMPFRPCRIQKRALADSIADLSISLL